MALAGQQRGGLQHTCTGADSGHERAPPVAAGLTLHTAAIMMLLVGCSSRHVSAATGPFNSTAAADSQSVASCSATLPKLVHHQTWESTRQRCAADVTVVTQLASNQ